ncbi:polyphosphate polymerase domain-containing protein [Anaerotalea alkaliphila]|uniref:Polyphosphate polymerase domain-containing protein n=1 Tax=Anaerotalea alkaliphila TaxID=2662126 RepID=A0A7X5HUY5_9FIRM|nr:polyphosphate polymerase domain-containing protein [Anaerotalea alkaliphila]NDL67133.1 polyphosphate polymerase domain-containing protein [Anaerotalea alkaliphila]
MEERCYRNEIKHLISWSAKVALVNRLDKVLDLDGNAQGKGYLVKSLYFDTLYDEALKEKLDGQPLREKFRLRCYNDDYSHLKFEKKVKEYRKGYKESCRVTLEEARRLAAGDLEFIGEGSAPLLQEFYAKSRIKLLRPTVTVVYDRRAYAYRPGNTRVTLDSRIRTSSNWRDFFRKEQALVPVGMDRCVLEVKFDRYLPDLVRDLVQVGETGSAANSKYVLGRMLYA